jgi:arginase family enzyme
MDLPFVGLATFARQPACPDWDRLDGADLGVLGVPIDTASSYRVGTRVGPRAVREVSMFHGFGPDFEDEVTDLTGPEVKIVDAGDGDGIYADTKRSLANAKQAVHALLDARTMPYILGGDHAITMATIAAFSLRKLRDHGVAASLAHIRDGKRVYVSIDSDSFDPSIAPGTATMSHGGFSYHEGEEILREVGRRFEVVGAEFVEVSPPYDSFRYHLAA